MADKGQSLTYMTLQELSALNDLYIASPGIGLPFTHDEILEELYQRGGTEAAQHMAELSGSIQRRIKQERPRRNLPVRPKLRAAALTALLLSLLCIAALAAFPSLFHFVQNDDTILAENTSGNLTLPDSGGEHASLAEALVTNDIHGLSPTWIPQRFSLESIGVDDLGGAVNIYAWYQTEHGDGFSIIVAKLSDDDLRSNRAVFEVDGDYEELVVNRITHYLESNMGRPKVTWESQNCIVSISGSLTVPELKQIVLSIYE